MISIPLTKFLFLDIETVGIEPDWDSLKKNREPLSFQFEHYFDWFQKRFPEDADKGVEQMFVNRAALVPEFSRIACVSVAFVTDGGETKMQSFSDPDEKKLLKDVQKLLHRIGNLGFYLCGHNVKGFDIPVLAKRMIMLAGLIPEKDIKINFTGLRAGEKLYEELFKDSEELQTTHHPKIMVAKKSIHDEKFKENLNNLIESILYSKVEEHKIKSLLKNIIPEYQA